MRRGLEAKPLRAVIAALGVGAVSLLIACGLDSPDDAPSNPTPTQAPATATRPPEVTPEPTATRTPAPTPSPSPSPSPTPSPTPPPSAQSPGADLVQLEEDMASALADYWVPGNYAVAVTDFQTGETVSVRGDVPQMSGCVMNLFVLYQVARDVEAGLYPLEKIDYLARATTWSSNGATARDLYAIAGNGVAKDGVVRVKQLVEDVMGLETVAIDHVPGYHADGLGVDYNNWVTAEEMNMALMALWRGEVVQEEYRNYLLEVLSEVKPGLNYLTAAVPEGIVSHKNGFFLGDTGYVDNDAGIVRLVRGDKEYAYAVTFLSEEVPTLYGDIVLGQQLSTLAYDVMAARYPETATAVAQTP